MSLQPYSDEHREAMIAALSYAFTAPPEEVPQWLERAGKEHVRLWMAGGRLAGTLIEIPMGIWLGGRSVKNAGIAGVATPPEARGQGHAYEMMAAVAREMRRDGFAVTTLYPATIGLYRKCGYELAGGHYSIRVSLAALAHPSVRERGGEIVPVGIADVEKLAAVLTPVARGNDGNLDRGPYVWARTFSPRLLKTRGFGVSFGGELEGYLILRAHSPTGSVHHDLVLTDLVARTPRAIRRLLGFLAEHRSLAASASWMGGPHDPFIALLPEKTYEMSLAEHFMLRVLDPKAALEARGYRVERPLALEVELHDPEIPENNGRVRVEVEDGLAHVVAPKGGPAIRAHVRGFSAMYAGFQPATALARMGWIEGDGAALAAADRIFLGPTPWMSEMF